MTPSLNEFDPRVIPFQWELLNKIRRKLDYSQGVHEILASGAIGSSKTAIATHLGVTHCLMYPGAHLGIGRLAMPDLKDTLFASICEHIDGVVPCRIIENRGQIFFPNKAKITSLSWADKKYKKARSREYSSFILEELTENDTSAAYDEIIERIRLPGIPEKWLLSLTNPDDPSHWVYDYFFIKTNPTKHVLMSKTRDNPFLEKTYVSKLQGKMSPREALRKLEGVWLELTKDIIYFEYSRDVHYRDAEYEVNPRYPIWWSHDFNIADGKPMSSCFFQYIGDTFHFFDEVVVDGARTLDVCEEAFERKLLDLGHRYIVTGDAAGKARDTRSKRSDYDIIQKYLQNIRTRAQYEVEAPRINPPVRKRHNIVNAYLTNDLKQHRVVVYKKCPTLDKGFRLTKLKSGGSYIEDDSKPWQHVTTAAGYGICKAIKYSDSGGGVIGR
ncbi:MAG: phage terminase large subunit [Coraliomargarita sp.]